ncbi:conserved domain protein [Bacteroides fluxus YIT 12057]|uniref:Conserved domain protein n=1 Tax=Bacteroides fluxus YIT 12057 TaxID=763034 RepID=F3PQI7_9BACE|nr:conserved domain protein [Bacteroides fluxus YIT 12057]
MFDLIVPTKLHYFLICFPFWETFVYLKSVKLLIYRVGCLKNGKLLF